MHNRSNTPDILGSIMSGGSVKQEHSQTLVIDKQEDAKEKATFNLPVQLLSELEDKYYEIRKLCKSKQVSKTLIVEEALKIVFSEFEHKKQASQLFLKLANNKNIKQ